MGRHRGPAGSLCERPSRSHSPPGLDLRPETLGPAHKRRDSHHCVQGPRTDLHRSWRILFPQRWQQFSRSWWGICLKQFNNNNHRRPRFSIKTPHSVTQPSESWGRTGPSRPWVLGRETGRGPVHCHGGKGSYGVRYTLKQARSPAWGARNPMVVVRVRMHWMRVGSERVRRRASVRCRRAQLKGPLLLTFTSFPEGLGCRRVGSRSLR